MGLFRKTQRKEMPLPALPPLPPLDNSPLPDLPPLPEFPDKSADQEFHQTIEMPGLSQDALKDLPPLPDLPDLELPPEQVQLPSQKWVEEPFPKMGQSQSRKSSIPPAFSEDQEPLPRKKIGLLPTQPLFVKGDDYRSLLSGISSIKARVNEAEQILGNLQQIEENKEKTMQKWRNELEDIQRSLVYVDKALFGG